MRYTNKQLKNIEANLKKIFPETNDYLSMTYSLIEDLREARKTAGKLRSLVPKTKVKDCAQADKLMEKWESKE